VGWFAKNKRANSFLNKGEFFELTHLSFCVQIWLHPSSLILERTKKMQEIPNEKILRLRSVLSRTGLSRSMAYALMSEKLFPKPIGLGARAVGWLESEIDSWIAERVKASRCQPVQ
jgi:prophage regulatory protein